ncbi:chromate transporter [Comamonas sp.]|uniref:chromate transporter n=1 Tax=Comamonas sp. TaxID=34028 RepID=UPI00289EA275|nr:chromate transporter [Comamonas sp.]
MNPLPTNAPTSPRQLFWAFAALALQGFGGVMAVVQRELVDRRRWLTTEQFAQDWALAQILPGPNVVNLSIMFGERHFGLRGALAASAGMLLAPTLLVLLLGSLYLQYASHPAVSGALRGMGAVAAGLVLGTGLKLSASLHKHPLPLWLGWLLSMAAFAMVVFLRWPLWWVLPMVGGIGCAVTWKRLTP